MKNASEMMAVTEQALKDSPSRIVEGMAKQIEYCASMGGTFYQT